MISAELPVGKSVRPRDSANNVSPDIRTSSSLIHRQTYPHGGRAIGSREMLDIREAEYGGEMLYINKSKHHP